MADVRAKDAEKPEHKEKTGWTHGRTYYVTPIETPDERIPQ